VGKRELGRRVAERLQIEWLDIEQQMETSDIEPASPESASQLTRDYNVSDGRGYELRQGLLKEGLRREGSRIIIAPPGCRVREAERHTGTAPPWVVWVRKSDWRYDARKREGEPPRHKSWKAEFEWRIQQRRPRWESRADFIFEVPYGRAVERSSQLLGERLQILSQASRSMGSLRSWSVPIDADELGRGMRDARHLGGGIKIRHSIFSEFPDLGERGGGPRVLAAIEEGAPAWMVQHGVNAVEVGVGRAVELAKAGWFGRVKALERIWVVAETTGVDGSAIERLGEVAQAVRGVIGGGLGVVPHWKPRIGAWKQFREVVRRTRTFRASWPGAAVTPVGARWVGMTPWFATRNPTFELATGLAAWRRGVTDSEEEPAADLQSMLPTLAGSPPETFDAIVGAHVTEHRAAEWHRLAALQDGEPYGAIACDTVRQPDAQSLEAMFDVLLGLGVRGVALESPLRRRVLEVDGVRNPEGLPAVNVLIRKADGWEGRDTDHVGMAAVLTEAARRGVEAGQVAMIGQDDRVPAIRRAIAAALGWRLVYHAEASGWGWDAPSHVALVMNLAGTTEGVYERPPSCELWVDLHEEVGSPPPVAEDHICGDRYFEAQALAARDLWRRG
jgi:hypothetical protein